MESLKCPADHMIQVTNQATGNTLLPPHSMLAHTHTHTHTLNLLVAKRACVYSFQHHLAEGYMVAQVNLSKSSVVQGLLFNEITRSHMKRRLRRCGHSCLKVPIKQLNPTQES